jgi:DNA primase
MSPSVAEAKAGVSIVAIINETLPLSRDGQIWRSRCPWHGERTASFTVFPEPSPGHYHCFGCGAHGDVVDWLMKERRMAWGEAMSHMGATPTPSRSQIVTPPAAEPQAARSPTLAAARQVWAEAVRARGTIVEAYLGGRRLSLPDDAPIRFHPECQRGPRDRTGCAILAPAMVCLMTDPVSGEPTGVHRTFLTGAGSKAPPITRDDRVLPSKSILGRWGSIRVPPPNETRGALAISEGLENGMSAQVLLEWEWSPIWAAGCQGSIAAFPVLPWATSLTIFLTAMKWASRLRAHAEIDGAPPVGTSTFVSRRQGTTGTLPSHKGADDGLPARRRRSAMVRTQRRQIFREQPPRHLGRRHR